MKMFVSYERTSLAAALAYFCIVATRSKNTASSVQVAIQNATK